MSMATSSSAPTPPFSRAPEQVVRKVQLTLSVGIKDLTCALKEL